MLLVQFGVRITEIEAQVSTLIDWTRAVHRTKRRVVRFEIQVMSVTAATPRFISGNLDISAHFLLLGPKQVSEAWKGSCRIKEIFPSVSLTEVRMLGPKSLSPDQSLRVAITSEISR